MDPEIINTVANFLSKYFIWEIIIMLLIVGLTALLKLPIKKAAEKLEEKYKVDKSILTWTIGFIPPFLAAIAIFILYWYKSGWSMTLEASEWAGMFTEIGVVASGAIGIYEFFKKMIQGAKAGITGKNKSAKIKKNSIQKVQKSKIQSKFRVEEKKNGKK